MKDVLPESGPVDRGPSVRPISLGTSRYQLIAQVATAGYGTLWVARVVDGPEEGRVAFARRMNHSADPSLGRRLAGAATIAMDVRDPKIAAVLDLVVTESEVAIVTEYVEGELLRSLQRRAGLGNKPITVAVALRIGLDVARGAIAARDGWKAAAGGEPTLKNLVHGGLGPDCILVATYGEPALLDVGVAGLAFARREYCDHPECIPYRAPEQLQGSVADDRTDVYSLGVVLWELLANRPLFGSPRFSRFPQPGDSAPPAATEESARTRHRVLEMPVSRLDAVVRAGERVPEDVAAIVTRALARKPGDRFASLDELESALSGLGKERFASSDDVGAFVMSLAGASIEARRIALAHVTGRPAPAGETRSDSARPTLAPAPSAAAVAPTLTELASTPDALSLALDEQEKPPPLPKKRKSRKG